MNKRTMSSEDEDEIVSAVPNFRKRRRVLSSDESDHCQTPEPTTDNKVVHLIDSDEEPQILHSVHDVDDDDDEDENDVMSEYEDDLFEDISAAPTSKASKRTLELREQVVNFLDTASEIDLEAIPGVSKKKVELLLTLRPIKNWVDLNKKIESHKSSSINEDIVLNALATMKTRAVVSKLMESCEKLAKDIGKLVDKLPEAMQPKCIPEHLKLSPYQLVGLNWLILMHNKGINAILADEMGLGKTIQVIGFLGYLSETLNIHRHFCVIVPSSTIDNWEREFDKWTPGVRILQYTGSQIERAHMRQWVSLHAQEVDIILTTYNIAQNPDDRRLFKKINFEYLIYDEAHMLKNMKSQRYQNLIKIKSKHRILLTGTPIQNNLVELMSLLVFTMPKIFASKMHHIESLFGSNISRENGGRTEYERSKIDQALVIMKPFILRRLKADVLKDLPKKTECVELCKMTPQQEKLYDKTIESFKKEIENNRKEILDDDESFVETKDGTKRGAAMLMAMRRLANHKLLSRSIYNDKKLKQMASILVNEDESHSEASEEYVLQDLMVMHDYELHALCKSYVVLSRFKLPDADICDSGKFVFLDKLLPDFKKNQKKCLIFSQFTMMLDIMEEFLQIRDYRYIRLDGTTKTSDRLELIDEFNQNKEIVVFLLSTKAGGLGINLTSASTVLIHDIDYNPMNDLQAQDRSYRIGQKCDVTCYKMISKNSIEEGILDAASEKLKLGEDMNGTTKQSLGAKDLRSLLRINLKL